MACRKCGSGPSVPPSAAISARPWAAIAAAQAAPVSSANCSSSPVQVRIWPAVPAGAACRLQAVQRGQALDSGMPEPPEVAHRSVCIGGPGSGNTFRPVDEIGDDDTDDADRLPRPQAFKLLQRIGPVLAAAQRGQQRLPCQRQRGHRRQARAASQFQCLSRRRASGIPPAGGHVGHRQPCLREDDYRHRRALAAESRSQVRLRCTTVSSPRWTAARPMFASRSTSPCCG